MIEVTLNVDGLVEPGGGFTSTASGVMLQFATGGLMSGTGACANADDVNKPATPKAPANERRWRMTPSFAATRSDRRRQDQVVSIFDSRAATANVTATGLGPAKLYLSDRQ